MLTKSLFAQWNNKERYDFTDREIEYFEKYEQADEVLQNAMHNAFPRLFQHPELIIDATNCERFALWLSACQLDRFYDIPVETRSMAQQDFSVSFSQSLIKYFNDGTGKGWHFFKGPYRVTARYCADQILIKVTNLI